HAHRAEIDVRVFDAEDCIGSRRFPERIFDAGAGEPAAMTVVEIVQYGAGRNLERAGVDVPLSITAGAVDQPVVQGPAKPRTDHPDIVDPRLAGEGRGRTSGLR